ncbi:MAG: kdsC [Parcubacteria group bacterium]|nr:kdsC [Parcubacteria group bacterium]
MDIQNAAKNIKVLFLDSDGVIFPNTVLMGAPFMAKSRSYYDGQGISLLRAIGIRIAIITNEKDQAADAIRTTVEKWNSLPSSKPQQSDGWEPIVLYEGCGGEQKSAAAEEFLASRGLSFSDAGFMGDDMVDVPLLRTVALPAAPASAERAIRDLCTFVAERNGGEGAIRDFTNMILAARNIDPFLLPAQ